MSNSKKIEKETEVQYLTVGGVKAVILPIEEYDRLRAAAEAQVEDEDVAALAAYRRTRDEEVVPAEIVNRLLADENPLKVWREFRGLTQDQLAKEAGLSRAYITQLEIGARRGSVKALRAVAQALGVDLDDISR